MNLLFTSCCVFVFSFSILCLSAADKEVEDYYSRKRHLPDLAARGILPLHVLKMSQDQVGAQVFNLGASEQGCILHSLH